MPEIKITDTEFIRVFVDKLMEDKGIPKAEQPKLREQLIREVDDRVETAMLETLTIEQLQQLNQLLDDGADVPTMDAFFAQLDGDYTRQIEQALAEYRRNFLQGKEA